MENLVENFFNWEIMRQALPTVFQGFLMTLLLCATVIPVGSRIQLQMFSCSQWRRTATCSPRLNTFTTGETPAW